MKQPFKVLRDIVHLITPIAGGTLVAKYATSNARQVYQKEKNPPFSPPGITYPIVWSGLYLAMGVAYMIARNASKDKFVPISHYTQLGLNFLWSVLYFKYKLRGAAMIESYALFASVVVTAVNFYKADKRSGLLMVPYALWCAFASYLATGSWILNKDQ
ncbi:tryptophan-rich sensory protein [Staphylococcus simulans]|uniref:TspO/MBR family protein n=1 Tax=Staphylococcus simulans TaxID=1286 RepID=UPI000E6A0200|nr:TspO/MBR family protein [Staphylococcus simulans]RIN43422.1 tryptophan-rich sensory protein [Staphylococcus simulans]